MVAVSALPSFVSASTLPTGNGPRLEASPQNRGPDELGNGPSAAKDQLQAAKDQLQVAQDKLSRATAELEECVMGQSHIDASGIRSQSQMEVQLTDQVMRATNDVKIAESILMVHNDRDRMFISVSGL